MKKWFYILTPLIVVQVACKKHYTCTCTSLTEKKDIFTIKSTKGTAKAKCKEYFDNTYASVPLNETICTVH